MLEPITQQCCLWPRHRCFRWPCDTKHGINIPTALCQLPYLTLSCIVGHSAWHDGAPSAVLLVGRGLVPSTLVTVPASLVFSIFEPAGRLRAEKSSTSGAYSYDSCRQLYNQHMQCSSMLLGPRATTGLRSTLAELNADVLLPLSHVAAQWTFRLSMHLQLQKYMVRSVKVDVIFGLKHFLYSISGSCQESSTKACRQLPHWQSRVTWSPSSNPVPLCLPWSARLADVLHTSNSVFI